MKEPSTAVVHFYRAIVMHADVWRRRLDMTTNWAVVTTIGVISFVFTRPEAPHFLLLLLNFVSLLFLMMESRRYQIYDIWRRRVRVLNRYMVAPNLSPHMGVSEEEMEEELGKLAIELGRTRPHLHFLDALGYRVRRNYGYLFLFSLGMWTLKVGLHPQEAGNLAQFVERAGVGAVPGLTVIVLVMVVSALILFVALRAPSEQMEDWRQIPSPWVRFQKSLLFRTATEDERSSGKE